jgi:hypothetical protein
MPIDPKDALGYLGINPEEIADMDAFKAHVSTTYVPRAEAHKDPDIMRAIVGRDKGVLRTKLKGAGKELGLEDVKWDDVDPTEGIDLLTARAKARTAELSSQLEEAKKGGKTPKEVEEQRAQFDRMKGEYEQRGSIIEQLQTEFNEFKENTEKEKRTWQIEEHWKNYRSKITPNADIDPLKMKGFEALLRERVKLDIDTESKKVIALDATTGKQFVNPNKLHTVFEPDEVFKQIATEAGIIGGNPQGGKPVKGTSTLLGQPARQPDTTPPGTPARRQIMPRA